MYVELFMRIKIIIINKSFCVRVIIDIFVNFNTALEK